MKPTSRPPPFLGMPSSNSWPSEKAWPLLPLAKEGQNLLSALSLVLLWDPGRGQWRPPWIPEGVGEQMLRGCGMAMAGPSIRRHIHALHPSPWHPLEERKNTTLHTEPLHESGQLIPPPPPNIYGPLPASLSPCITKARFPGCF